MDVRSVNERDGTWLERLYYLGVLPHNHRINKQQEGSKIWMVGGAGLLDAFMKERLIDEMIITITPHILGSGVPLFKPENPEMGLTLLEVKRFNQFAQLLYKVNQS